VAALRGEGGSAVMATPPGTELTKKRLASELQR
jgi:hypothetical protein